MLLFSGIIFSVCVCVFLCKKISPFKINIRSKVGGGGLIRYTLYLDSLANMYICKKTRSLFLFLDFKFSSKNIMSCVLALALDCTISHQMLQFLVFHKKQPTRNVVYALVYTNNMS